MKNVVFVCLMALLCLKAQAQISDTINISVQEISISQSGNYDILEWSLGNGYVQEVSLPQLPVLRQTFVIPRDATVIGVEYSISDLREIVGSYLLKPVPEPVEVSNSTISDDSIVSNANMGQKVQIVSDYDLMGYHLVEICIIPFEYSYEDNKLSIHNVSFTINYERNTRECIQTQKQSQKRYNETKEFIKSIVVNSHEVDACSDTEIDIANNSFSDINKAPTQPGISGCETYIEVVPDYIIITCDSLKEEFSRLAHWKTKKGTPTIVKTVEDIYAEFAGCDNAEQIRNYLYECYIKWGDALYVLLGGDSEIVPSRFVPSVSSDKKFHTPSDAYYSHLKSEWSKKHDGNFKYVLDNNICLYLGRAPVEDALECGIFVDKVINYEKANHPNVDYSYVNNYLFAAAYISNNGKLSNGAHGFIYRNLTSYHNLIKWLQLDHYNCSCTLHDKENEFEDGEELNKENFLSALQDGGNSNLNHFHIIYHMDHCYPHCMGTSIKDKQEMITNVDVDNLSNGSYLPIIISGGCDPANFSYDCIAEHFINNPNGGAVAFIGNTDVGRSYEYDFWFTFLNSINKESRRNIGKAYCDLIPMLWPTNHRLHLLGDPEMPVWSKTPKDLDVVTSHNTSNDNEYNINVQIKNLPEGESATICIMKEDEIYFSEILSDTLIHSYSFVLRNKGKLYITITGHNYRPYESSINVDVESDNRGLEIVDIQSDSSRFDCQLMPGGFYNLNVFLKNSSSNIADSVLTLLKSNSPFISLKTENHYTDSLFLDFGDIVAGEICTHDSGTPFEIMVSKDAPETNDCNWNNANLILYAYDCNNNKRKIIDLINFEIIYSRLKIVKVNIDTIKAGTIVPFNIELENLKKSENAYVTVESNCASAEIIDSILFSTDNTFCGSIRIRDEFSVSDLPKLTLKVYSNGVLVDSLVVDLNDDVPVSDNTNFRFAPGSNSISLYWDKLKDASLYNIYRYDSINGDYVRINSLPISSTYFKDEGLGSFGTYYYKLSALNSSLVESNVSEPIKAWTSFEKSDAFPVILDDGASYDYFGAVTMIDYNYDGIKEIIATAKNSDEISSKIVVLKPDGTDVFDIDDNPETISGYAYIPAAAQATPTVADIYGNGIPCVLSVTRNMDSNLSEYLYCFSSQDNNNDNKPDSLWRVELASSSYRSVIATDINSCDGKGEKEIIVRGESPYNICVVDCRGNILYTINELVGSSYGVPAVADLDNDGYKEIIAGTNDKMFVWNHDGSLRNNTVLFDDTNDRNISSTPVVCDIDNDGSKDILVATKGDSLSYIYAIRQDGSLIAGFDGSSTAANIPYQTESSAAICHSISVGDINNDDNLEVVALGVDCVKAWRNDGTILLDYRMKGIFPDTDYIGNIFLPILADVDGDSVPDIIFSIEKNIYAIDIQGNMIVGFPIVSGTKISNMVSVSDIDRDGKNEIAVLGDGGHIYVWDTYGSPSSIEWGRSLYSTENTTEYISGYNDPWVITENITWEGGGFTNDIIVRSGIFTIPQGKTLTMRKPYRIYVMDEATLNVKSGTIENADIVVKNGGVLNISDNAKIYLRSTGGNIKSEIGATVNISSSSIE